MRKTLVGLLAIACVVPALALAAADPKPNSHFSWCTAPQKCPLDFDTNGKGTKIKNMSFYPKCAPIPVKPDGAWPPMKVNNGKFHGQGTLTDFAGSKITYEIDGKFKRPKKAVGTFNVDSDSCSDKEHDFVAKRDGKAQGAPY